MSGYLECLHLKVIIISCNTTKNMRWYEVPVFKLWLQHFISSNMKSAKTCNMKSRSIITHMYTSHTKVSTQYNLSNTQWMKSYEKQALSLCCKCGCVKGKTNNC